jgi:hypothetical protein
LSAGAEFMPICQPVGSNCSVNRLLAQGEARLRRKEDRERRTHGRHGSGLLGERSRGSSGLVRGLDSGHG